MKALVPPQKQALTVSASPDKQRFTEKSKPTEIVVTSQKRQSVSPGTAKFNFVNIPVFKNQPSRIQPKLTVNTPGDAYEKEADETAEQIMGPQLPEFAPPSALPVNKVLRKCAACDKEKEPEEDKEDHLQRREAGPSNPQVTPAVGRTLKLSGQPLDDQTRTFMEGRFGYDFSKVRIHDDSMANRSAGDINALAYTHQYHVVFGSGQFQPETDKGKKLLAHELTHLIQQTQAGSSSPIIAKAPSMPPKGGQPMDNRLQAFMEKRFDHDFSGVRLHTDGQAVQSANQLGALAFTVGQDIFFNKGGYRPDTLGGVHLIAHELTHVVQQSKVAVAEDGRLSVNAENSSMELEANKAADLVLAGSAKPDITPALSASISRSTGWSFLGGLIGAIAGGLLGALAGPLGAVIGAVGGAALGAWVGGAATNTKKDDKRKPAGLRITELLSTSATDFVVTEQEALLALEILRELEKKDPVELFEVAQLMKFSGRWKTLYEKLPSGDRLGLQYFDKYALHPDHGYIMPYDRIHLEFNTPARFRYEQNGAAPYKRDDSLEFLSNDYDLDQEGITLPFNIGKINIAGKSLQDAASIVAKAMTDPLWAYEMSVELRPVKRGAKYIGLGEVSSPETVRAGAVTSNQTALALRDKRRKFSEHVSIQLASAGGRTGMAVDIYYKEVEQHLDKYEDPEALWQWAKGEADRTFAELEKKSPAQKFLEFGKDRLAFAAKMPEKELARTNETYYRYLDWFYKNEHKPGFERVKPMDIWVKAYLNIVLEEVDKDVQKSMDALKQKRRDDAWQKAEEKLGETIEYMKHAILPGTRDEYISTKEEVISEETGEVVTKGWLIMESEEEKFMRDKIASDFLHAMIEALSKDPENFVKTSVKDDFEKYLRSNPDQYTALSLTISHPYVERHEDKVDISGWSTALEVVVGFIPFVGTGVSIYEIISGRDLSGHPLSTTEKTIIGIGVLLPGIFKTVKAGRGAFKASGIVREYGLLGAEADRVYSAYMKLGPGTKGAKLFGWGFNEIKAGRKIEDPKVLKQMEAVLKDMGMTEKQTAKALMPSVERQVETAAADEVKQVKTIIGPITEETETMLKNNPELREALKENSLAAIVLKKCNSPCIPEQATAAQVKELEGLLQQIKKTGMYDEEALRTFLYKRRGELDTAIGEVKQFAGSKRIQGGTASKDLNAWLEFRNSDGVITKGVDPELIKAKRYLAHDIGVEGGRAQAGLDGLSLSGYDPGIKTGSHGQGFDDIAVQGKNWDHDAIYVILEHKGGEGKLQTGQMELDWVVGNIQRMYREGGAEGQKWAARLAKALEEGRLKGRAYSTEVVNKAAGVTKNIGDWHYPKTKIKL